MTTTHEQNSTIPTTPVLYFSLELGSKTWKLAFTIGLGQKPRLRTIAARDTDALLDEIKAAKKRFGLPDNAKVDRVEITWPSGQRQTIAAPALGKLHDVVEPKQ